MTAKQTYVVIAAGGTGGHMMPADAMASELVERGSTAHLITDKRGDKFDNIMQDIQRTVLPTMQHMGKGLLPKIKSATSILISRHYVIKMFRKNRPDVVVGFGGYPSLPTVLAAKWLRIPYILHEQNAVLGRVNRLMGEGAAGIALSYEATAGIPAEALHAVTGNPVRKVIEKIANIAYAVPMGAGDIRLFIMGGSQGARILSDIVPTALVGLEASYRDRLVVSHQARAEDVARVKTAYKSAGIRAEVEPYFDDVAAILLRAQLVISRAGASTLAELTVMGRPAVLVPLAIATNDHQSANASVVRQAGGGWVFTEDQFTSEALIDLLTGLFIDMGGLRKASDGMRRCATIGAADHLADLVLEVAENTVNKGNTNVE